MKGTIGPLCIGCRLRVFEKGPSITELVKKVESDTLIEVYVFLGVKKLVLSVPKDSGGLGVIE
jgi:hypothetical protein